MTESAILALEDGTIFKGISVGAPGQTIGEVVFVSAWSIIFLLLRLYNIPQLIGSVTLGFMQ